MPDGKEIPCVKGGTKAKKKSKSTKASEKYKKAEQKKKEYEKDEQAKLDAYNTARRIAPKTITWTRGENTFEGPSPNDQYGRVVGFNNLGLSDNERKALLSRPHYGDEKLGGGSRKSRKSNRLRKTKSNRRKSRRIR
jgi:hypothetical protein